MNDTTERIEGAIQEPDLAPWRGPAAFRALRNRNFAYFWVGLIISATGSWMQSMAQGWLVFDLTDSNLYLGLVTGMGQLPVLLLTLHAGVIADRFNKRRIVIFTQTGLMLSALGLAAVGYCGLIRPWHIFVFAVINGCLNAFDMPARQSMMMEIVGKDDLVNALALNSSAFNGARLVGPALAGITIAAWGARFCFLLNGISYAAVIVALLMVRGVKFRTSSGEGSMLRDIVEGLRYALSQAVIRDILILTAAASIFALQYPSQMPAFAKQVLHLGPGGLGALVSAAGLGALIAALTFAALGHRIRLQTMITVGALLTPVAIMALSFSRSLPMALACLVCAGFGLMMFLAVSNSVIQMASPDRLRGRMLAVRTLVFIGLAPLGALQIGLMAQYLGVAQSLRIGASACLLVALYFTFRSKAVRAP